MFIYCEEWVWNLFFVFDDVIISFIISWCEELVWDKIELIYSFWELVFVGWKCGGFVVYEWYFRVCNMLVYKIYVIKYVLVYKI